MTALKELMGMDLNGAASGEWNIDQLDEMISANTNGRLLAAKANTNARFADYVLGVKEVRVYSSDSGKYRFLEFRFYEQYRAETMLKKEGENSAFLLYVTGDIRALAQESKTPDRMSGLHISDGSYSGKAAHWSSLPDNSLSLEWVLEQDADRLFEILEQSTGLFQIRDRLKQNS